MRGRAGAIAQACGRQTDAQQGRAVYRRHGERRWRRCTVRHARLAQRRRRGVRTSVSWREGMRLQWLAVGCVALVALCKEAACDAQHLTMPQANAKAVCAGSSALKGLARWLTSATEEALNNATREAAEASARAATATRWAAVATGAAKRIAQALAQHRQSLAKAADALASSAKDTRDLADAAARKAMRLAGQIDGMMLTLATYSSGSNSGSNNALCISAGTGLTGSGGLNKDKFQGNSDTKIKAALSTIGSCLETEAQAKTPTEVKAALDANFITPFDGMGHSSGIKIVGADTPDEGCNLLSGHQRNSANGALFTTASGAYPFAVLGGLWTVTAKTANQGIALVMAKKGSSTTFLDTSKKTATVTLKAISSGTTTTAVTSANEHPDIGAMLAEAEKVEKWLNGTAGEDGTREALIKAARDKDNAIFEVKGSGHSGKKTVAEWEAALMAESTRAPQAHKQTQPDTESEEKEATGDMNAEGKETTESQQGSRPTASGPSKQHAGKTRRPVLCILLLCGGLAAHIGKSTE
ncbi:hypothetical protein, conserved in T. vivax [Trypanosoma vivax Y486]|uniref:Variant surface glycoprotein n=1 Tax=Trypanosoma vivax (strain Y486) TaxID=1055687 RepID=F9WPQ0_TRYVY|nr:hypothetical protein, conserved in T. vivax [Trypanosoma vivax Y486]|eukprot:CCD19527.1 hypothetical protein, conserved in T. vivax [Trypanosoma vivax Y486]